MLGAQLQRGDNVVVALWQDYAEWHHLIVTGVGAVNQTRGMVGANFTRNMARKCFGKGMLISGHRTDCSCSMKDER